jgi:D-amino-acid dehydrogenase
MKNKVVVIGGGIIGVSTALELARRGHRVQIIEKNKIGHGCSYGNAGWMTPCFAMPLPMPGMLFKSMKWMLNPEGPLYIKPTPTPLLLSWLLNFMKNMNEKQALRAVGGLVELSKISLRRYREIADETGNKIKLETKGLLMASRGEAGVKAAEQELHYVEKFGIPGKKMTGEEIKAFEPALQGELLGGVYFPEEAHAEPLTTVLVMADLCRKLGVEITEGCEYTGVEIENDKIKSIQTTSGRIEADAFVLATGSWSQQLAKALRLRIPILGGKGYAMIVPPLKIQPTHPIMLIEKKIAITPREGSLRIAGTLELVNQDFSVTQRRVDAIIRGAQEYLTLPNNPEIKETWAGLRPCTPDGIPLIGWNKNLKNLMLACGHQMLGFQMGAGTGVVIADIFDGKQLSVDAKLFDPSRF